MPGIHDGTEWWEDPERFHETVSEGDKPMPKEPTVLFQPTEIAPEAVLGPDTPTETSAPKGAPFEA
jgi:hypothetical protein